MKKKLISYISSALAVVLGIVLILISVMFEFIVPTDSDKTKKPTIKGKPSQSDDASSEDSASDEYSGLGGYIFSNTDYSTEDYGDVLSFGDATQVEGDSETVAKVDAMVNDDTDVDPAGKVYYVDAVNGNDNNDGLSPSRPFLSLYRVNSLTLNPGDRVLFKRGCVWNGELVIQDSGTAEHPIVIGMYGSGQKPLINGCGEVFATVFICDASYVTVRNLEVTNYRTDMTDYRSCIYVAARKSEVIKGVKIQNNYCHSSMNLYAIAKTNMAGFHGFGAIAFNVQKGKTWDQETINFEDIIIENNRVDRINGTGICAYNGVKNAQIRNNIVSNVTGDGIILGHAFDSVIEYNIAYTSGFGGIGNPHVNIWTYVAQNCVMQYNESYDCQSTVQDGQGFDIDDDCNNCILQYNYSHDNVGGFFLGCDYYGEYYENIVRYNISQNDKKQIFFLVCPSSKTLNYDPEKLVFDIYNNTIYSNQIVNDIIVNEVFKPEYEDYARLRNNIIVLEDSPNADWGESDMSCVFSNNCFVGMDNSLINDPYLLEENPLLLAAGTGKTGRSTVGGYQLLKNSPCIGAGTLIENNGGLDYFGNPVSATAAPNIGAYAGSGVSRPEGMNLTAGKIPKASFYSVSKLASQASYLAPLTDEKISTSVVSKASNENSEQQIEFTFDEAVTLSSVLITSAADPTYFPVSYSVEVYSGGKWVKVGSYSETERIDGGCTVAHNFSAVSSEKLRITAHVLGGSGSRYAVEFAEIAAFSVQKTIK